MVLSGSDFFYERTTVGSVVFINNGMGGRAIVPPTVPTEGRHQYTELHGAGRITATPESLLYEFKAVGGTLIDSVSLTKEDTGIVITEGP